MKYLNAILMVLLPLFGKAQPMSPNDSVFVANQALIQTSGSGPSPLAAWYLNNNANDSSGNGYNGTLEGSPTFTTGQNGATDGAIVLNGMSQYVQCPVIANGLTAFSVSAWFKTSNANNAGPQRNGPLVSNIGSGGINTGEGWSLTMDGTTDEGNIPGSIECIIQGSGGVDFYDFQTTTAFNNNVWHLAVFTYDNSSATLTLYIDGALATVGNFGSGTVVSSYSNAGNVLIGSDPSSQFFNGEIDDARIYSLVLTSGQIATLFSNNAAFYRPDLFLGHNLWAWLLPVSDFYS